MIVGGKTGVLDENSFTARFFLLNTRKARSYGCSRNPLMTYTRHKGLLRTYEGKKVMKHPLTSHMSEKKSYGSSCIFHQPLKPEMNQPQLPGVYLKFYGNFDDDDFFLNVFPG